MIPVYQPYLNGNEKKYVMDCMDTTWISSKGAYIQKFENKFGEFIGSDFVTTVNNGTTAIHLALMALGIQPGDEIIVPSFTYVASVNMIVANDAVPVFVDSDLATWQVDLNDVKRKITPKTKALMVVHLYGFCCDLYLAQQLCKEHNLFLIEDCAEAFGTFYKGQHVGTFGDVATFSFFGNKTITTGEGGMCVAKSGTVYNELKHLKNQGVSQSKQYWHDVVAYNYRMTNIQAAIGLAQVEQLDDILARKKAIAQYYRDNLVNLPLHTDPMSTDIINSSWMCSIIVDPALRESLRQYLADNDIETRPFFYPSHVLPMYTHSAIDKYPVAELLGASGINLPSYPALTEEQLEFICATIRKYFNV